jgi:cytochrome d ubiquinol oxidase subunit I
VVQGLKDFPKDERPPIGLSFYSFHLMVGLGFYFIMLTSVGMLLWWRDRLMDSRWFMKLALWSIPLPFIANELGWIAAEVGRQPWIVYGVMKTREAFSTVVPGGQVLASILMFSAIYTLLFIVWIYLLRRKLHKGPEGEVTA